MGRGRAKAKQTKVARDLKYSTSNTDFEALQKELQHKGHNLSEESQKEILEENRESDFEK